MNSTSRSTSSPSEKDPIKAIHDPFGYGYEGRIGVDRETSTRRKGITAVLNRFVTRGIKAPEAAQYDYLITHGFYTVEELKKVGNPYLTCLLFTISGRTSFEDWIADTKVGGITASRLSRSTGG